MAVPVDGLSQRTNRVPSTLAEKSVPSFILFPSLHERGELFKSGAIRQYEQTLGPFNPCTESFLRRCGPALNLWHRNSSIARVNESESTLGGDVIPDAFTQNPVASTPDENPVLDGIPMRVRMDLYTTCQFIIASCYR